MGRIGKCYSRHSSLWLSRIHNSLTVSKLENRCIWVFFITMLIRIINGHCWFILDFSFGYMKENWYISNYFNLNFRERGNDETDIKSTSLWYVNNVFTHFLVQMRLKVTWKHILERNCAQSFGNLCNLRRHLTTYTEDKSFGCSQCTESRSPRKSNCRIIYKFTQERNHFAAPSAQRHLL